MKDGGPAFACAAFAPEGVRSEDCLGNDAQEGMSLRDYFAAKAMQGLAHAILIEQHWEDVMKRQGILPAEFPDFLAHLSYTTADAMLRRRSS